MKFLKMRKGLLLLICSFVCLSSPENQLIFQSSIDLTQFRTAFLPRNAIELIGVFHAVRSLIRCTMQCNQNRRCRTFDYDSSSLVCRLFEGQFSTGRVLQNETLPSSRIGAMVFNTNAKIYSSYNQTCDHCSMGSNRYLECINGSCQCPLNNFWNGEKCLNQFYNGSNCNFSLPSCRQDFNLSCSSTTNICEVTQFADITSSSAATLTSTASLTMSMTTTASITAFNSCTHLRWNQTGVVVAGTGSTGTAAHQLDQPYCIYIDVTDAMYICDYNNNRIQKWLPAAANGSTVAGDSGCSSGPASTLLDKPTDIAFDLNGNMYVADMNNNRVQMFAPNSTVGTTVAGQTGGGGNANNQLSHPMSIKVDNSLKLYVADTNNKRLVEWAPNATSGTILIDGTSVASNQLVNPYGIILMNGSSDQVYLSDNNLNRVQLWTFGAAQANTTVAGVNSNEFDHPTVIMFDPYGNLYVTDTNHQLVKMFCVNSTNATSVAGGPGSSPALNHPSGIAFDSNLNLYVSDTGNNRVLKYQRL